MSEVKFVGGIDGNRMWLDNGKRLSRNYRQGDRVYDSNGLATTLTSQPVGGTGGFTSLYLIDETEEIGMNNAISTQKVYEKKSFTYASAFAGIGGMTLGLKPLGGEGVIAWEYDPTEKRRQYAQEAHRLLHPEIPVHGDICEAKTEEIPDFDILCFTPPCQSFSVAGKRGGFEDTRGTLTFEALRIANDKRPKALFMENVKGIVNHDKGDTMSTIIHAINEIGYTVDFTVLNSKFFDVAQNRERIYLIGIRDDLITPEPWNDVRGTTMLPKAKRRYQEEGAKTFNFDWPKQTEVRTRLRDFLEDSVDEKYYLSEDKTAKLVAQLEATTGKTFEDVVDVKVIQRAESGTRLRDESGTLRQCLNHQHIVEKGRGIDDCESVLTQYQRFVEREGYVPELFNPYNNAEVGDIAPTQTAQCSRINNSSTVLKIEGLPIKEATTNDEGHREPKIAEQTEGPCYRIRKLSPRECLRLQSVPEDAIDVILTHFSDSRAYKFAGNGLTTNVITAIGERLLPYL